MKKEKDHEEADTQIQDTEESSDDYEDTDIDSASECMVIPADNIHTETPTIDELQTLIGKVVYSSQGEISVM